MVNRGAKAVLMASQLVGEYSRKILPIAYVVSFSTHAFFTSISGFTELVKSMWYAMGVTPSMLSLPGCRIRSGVSVLYGLNRGAMRNPSTITLGDPDSCCASEILKLI